jgi:L-alanine-DL-glutamate epimerase-like enolase superfamily enzyme
MESWPAIIPFRISNHVWDDFPCVVCEIEQGGLLGRGEALGVYYLDETTDSMAAELEAIIPELETGADQQRLLELLPPGGARMAADAALWDLETQITGRSAWSKAGVGEEPIETVFTIGLEDTPEAMAAKAAAAADISLFKVKLGAGASGRPHGRRYQPGLDLRRITATCPSAAGARRKHD